MSRSAHIASEALTSIKLVLSNFYLPNLTFDTGLGATAAVTAAIEYNGVFSQVLFSGSTSGTIADASLIFSDYTSVSIPAGATFWVRVFWHNTAGTFYNSWQNTFLGESVALSATVISDQTMSGTITNSAAVSHPPIAVLGMTSNASVVILGDSIGSGYPFGLDTEDSSSSVTGRDGKVGVIARSLGSIPFINLSNGGETAQGCFAASTARRLLWSKGSHAITQYSVNDLNFAGRTAVQIVADLQSVWSNLSGFQKVYQTTTTPLSTSTDAWATVVNQATLVATERVNFNTAVRAGITGATGFFDVASALESSLNSGKWTVTPTPPYTSDGIHPVLSGNQLVASSGVISGITWP